MAGEALDRLARCLRRRQAECPPRGPPAPACSRTRASVGSPRCANGRHRLESASLHGRERPPRKPFPPGVPGPSQSRVRGDLSGCVRRPDVISPFTKLFKLGKPDSAADATNSPNWSAGNSGVTASGGLRPLFLLTRVSPLLGHILSPAESSFHTIIFRNLTCGLHSHRAGCKHIRGSNLRLVGVSLRLCCLRAGPRLSLLLPCGPASSLTQEAHLGR